jgi:hypothetical protein
MHGLPYRVRRRQPRKLGERTEVQMVKGSRHVSRALPRDRSRSTTEPAQGLVSDEIATLVYELLDAQADTAAIAAELAADGDVEWRAHLEYLRALQRVGREVLARAAAEQA